jgi:hypothetical protein
MSKDLLVIHNLITLHCLIQKLNFKKIIKEMLLMSILKQNHYEKFTRFYLILIESKQYFLFLSIEYFKNLLVYLY